MRRKLISTVIAPLIGVPQRGKQEVVGQLALEEPEELLVHKLVRQRVLVVTVVMDQQEQAPECPRRQMVLTGSLQQLLEQLLFLAVEVVAACHHIPPVAHQPSILMEVLAERVVAVEAQPNVRATQQ